MLHVVDGVVFDREFVTVPASGAILVDRPWCHLPDRFMGSTMIEVILKPIEPLLLAALVMGCGACRLLLER